MKLFISWSGDQSREFAEFLKEWFGKIIPQGVETFVSSRDVEKGGRGMNTIAEALETGDFGVVIVTRDSQTAPWINFEAGALSKAVATAHVAPLLLDIPKADVTGPLTQFQMTSADDESDVRKLVDSINRATGQEVAKATIDILFKATWAEFAAKVQSAGATGQSGRKPHRTEREMITELLELVRELRREARRPLNSGGSVARTSASVRTNMERSRIFRTEDTILHELQATIPRLSISDVGFQLDEDGEIAAVELSTAELGSEALAVLSPIANMFGVELTVRQSNGRLLIIGPDGAGRMRATKGFSPGDAEQTTRIVKKPRGDASQGFQDRSGQSFGP